MRNCSRCHSSSPTGLRFCNYCGARLDEGPREEDLVFGNLALAPEQDAHYVPPRHLRAVPDSQPVARARAIASRARELAGVAGRAAAEVAADVATKVAARLQAASQPQALSVVPTPSPAVTAPRALAAAPAAPVARAASNRAEPAPAAAPLRVVPEPGAAVPRDLKTAYELYRRGRTAYDAGDRARATQLFAAALGKAPPESPLGQFLARVVKVKPSTEAPVAAAVPAPVASAPTPARARETRAAFPEVPSPEHGLVDLSGAGPAVQSRRAERGGSARDEDAAGVARHRRLPAAERRVRARKAAQRSWLRSLPEKSPNRPSQLLDGAGDGAQIERLAGIVMVVSGLGFLGLLLL